MLTKIAVRHFRFAAVSMAASICLCSTGVRVAADDQSISGGGVRGSDPVIQSMSAELNRSMDRLQLPGRPKPYYVRYELTDDHSRRLSYELGAKTNEKESRTRQAYADVRVGSYDFDNSLRTNRAIRTVSQRPVALDDDGMGLRRQLWLLTDGAYKQAVEQYQKAQAYKRQHELRHNCESFSQEKPTITVLPDVSDIDPHTGWDDRVRNASRVFQEFPVLRSSYMAYDNDVHTRRVLNSEGTMSKYSRSLYEIAMVAYARTPDGVDLWDVDYAAADNPKDLPSQGELEQMARRLGESLTAETKAERKDYYFGPVLFEEPAAAEIVQQGIAPLLCAMPGDNLEPSHSLIRSFNERVLPQFLTITDDPDLKDWKGKPLPGHGPIDSDGIPSKKVTLIDHGFLRDLLSGRSPVYPGEHSNGHNINDSPTASTLVVSADKSLDANAMREKLIALAKARGLKEAIIVRRVVPDTALILNGSPQDPRSDRNINRLGEVYSIDVTTGKMRRVRGLAMGGFDRQMMENIVAAGDDPKSHVSSNWRGYIRGVISPSLLLDNIELEEDAGESLSPYPVPQPTVSVKPSN